MFDDRDDSPPDRRHPAAALALAAIAAAGLTGTAVAGLTWSFDRLTTTAGKAGEVTGAAQPEVRAPTAASPEVSTPGWADTLRLPPPVPAAEPPATRAPRGAAPARRGRPPGTVEAAPTASIPAPDPSPSVPAPEPSPSDPVPDPSPSAPVPDPTPSNTALPEPSESAARSVRTRQPARDRSWSNRTRNRVQPAGRVPPDPPTFNRHDRAWWVLWP